MLAISKIVTNTILVVHLYWQERKIMGRKSCKENLGQTERYPDADITNFGMEIFMFYKHNNKNVDTHGFNIVTVL